VKSPRFMKQPTELVRFDVREALARAGEILSAPPAKPHIVRIDPVGSLVARLVLSLALCEPQNRKRVVPRYVWAQKRAAILAVFQAQLRGQLPQAPLPGRPMVLCTRFSSVEADAFADSFKLAIDCLCPSKKRLVAGVPKLAPGLGLIRDDKPSLCDVRQRWEYAPPKLGFCLVEVYTGAETRVA
jgi:hypothetical protein